MPLSFREKAGYAMGDAAANLVFQTMLYFQATFYTDTFGLTAAAAGTLFLVVRVGDAIFDPLVGVLADRTTSRWGKFRPWVIATAVPFGLLFWLAFTTPQFGGTGKLVYAYVTYIALMAIYSANNLPYSALNGVMTGDIDERTSLSSFRFVAAMAAGLVVQSCTLPLVAKLGRGDSARGWQSTIGIFAVAAIVLFVITFFSAKERILPDPGQRSSLKQDCADLLRNGPWVAMFFLTLGIFTTLSLRGSSLNYYFNYYADPQALANLLHTFGFSGTDAHHAAGNAFSFFNLVGGLVTLGAVFLAEPLSRRFGKKGVFTVCLGLTTLVTAAFDLLAPGQVWAMFAFSLLWPLAYGPTIPLLWAMIADTADFSEWKTGRRATGFVYAGIVFALKAGLGLGGYICGKVLSEYGYQPNAAQTADGLTGIRLCVSLFSALPFLIGVLCLIAYPISHDLNQQIGRELADRRRGREPALA